MRSFIALAFASLAVADWNPKICNGSGGCTRFSTTLDTPVRCNDGSSLNLQQGAGAELAASRGDYQIVSRAEFPSVCMNGNKPGSTDTLVKRNTSFGQTMYHYIAERSCAESKPEANCYSEFPNPAYVGFCTIVDSKGQPCTAA